MTRLLLLILLTMPLLAKPKILTYRDVGEVVDATYTGTIETGQVGLRLQAGGGQLGLWDGPGKSWDNVYAKVTRANAGWKEAYQDAAKVYLTSGVTLRPLKHDPKILTIKGKSGKSFQFKVPILNVSTSGEYTWGSGHPLPEKRLYLGDDGKCYVDQEASVEARP